MHFLNTGRSRARAEIFETVFFIVDKIRSFPGGVDEARANGYEISFHGEIDENFNTAADAESPPDRWNIAHTKCVISTATEQEKKAVNDHNKELYTELGRLFPEL